LLTILAAIIVPADRTMIQKTAIFQRLIFFFGGQHPALQSQF
jgi:hypothetical protein